MGNGDTWHTSVAASCRELSVFSSGALCLLVLLAWKTTDGGLDFLQEICHPLSFIEENASQKVPKGLSEGASPFSGRSLGALAPHCVSYLPDLGRGHIPQHGRASLLQTFLPYAELGHTQPSLLSVGPIFFFLLVDSAGSGCSLCWLRPYRPLGHGQAAPGYA